MITPTQFKARFPEFVSVLDARVQIFLDDASLSLNPDAWGAKYDLGQAYLAAHLLAVAQDSEAGGATVDAMAVKTEKVGEVMRSYSETSTPESSATADDFASTLYGLRYLSLRNELVATPFVL